MKVFIEQFELKYLETAARYEIECEVDFASFRYATKICAQLIEYIC